MYGTSKPKTLNCTKLLNILSMIYDQCFDPYQPSSNENSVVNVIGSPTILSGVTETSWPNFVNPNDIIYSANANASTPLQQTHVDEHRRKPKSDDTDKLKVANRSFKCSSDERLQKSIKATYPKGVSSTKEGHRVANPFVLVIYTWKGKYNIPGPDP